MKSLERKTAAKFALPLAIAALLFLSILALAIGDSALSLREIWSGLIRENSFAATILWEIRIPRILVAIAIGAALSASGLIMQAYFRNSLASPGLLGVSSGGAAGAVLSIALGWASASIFALPLFAIIGAFIATGAVLALARHGTNTERLLLSGIALNALLGALTSYMLTNATLTYERNAQIVFWLIGGLSDRTWEHVWIAAPIALAAILLWPLGRPMDLLSLGSAEAQSLGVDVHRLRKKLIVLSTVMTALATAVSGMIGFVGLVVPHVLRLLVGAEHRRLVPLSLIAGAAFVLGCDLLARYAGEVRVGIVTAIIGGPFFIWLLRRKT